jgi:hypothetical protein
MATRRLGGKASSRFREGQIFPARNVPNNAFGQRRRGWEHAAADAARETIQ